jgi:hypothetical protein
VSNPSSSSRHWLVAGLVLVVGALVLQAWTLGNPGYYSHDELQWAAQAADPAGARLWDWQALQFRPLTFGLWMGLSRALFAAPMAFHAVFVALGLANAVALLGLLRRLGVRPGVATAMTLGFVLGPFAAFTQAWVATLADLLWVGAGLALAHVVVASAPVHRTRVAVLAALLTAAALLAKESALVLPALCVLALWLDPQRPWKWAALGSAVPSVLYLALRAGAILFGDRPAGAYEWSLLAVPDQAWRYFVFVLAPSLAEIETLGKLSATHLAAAAAILLALVAALWRAGRGYAIAWVVGGLMALGPVLILRLPANQYGYGFSALLLAVIALAWTRLPTWGCVLAGMFVFVGVWHGVDLQRHVRAAGEKQARFSPALAEAVLSAQAHPVRIRNAGADAWLYDRLTTDVPGYLGVPIGDRVLLVGARDAADYAIAADGSLVPLEPL